MVTVAGRLVSRPKAHRRFARRWAARIGASLGTALTVLFVVAPMSAGVYFVHKQPRPLPAGTLRDPAPRRQAQRERWTRPRRLVRAVEERRPVVLVHGAGGDRAGGIASRATMLARHGYGVLVLVYD